MNKGYLFCQYIIFFSKQLLQTANSMIKMGTIVY